MVHICFFSIYSASRGLLLASDRPPLNNLHLIGPSTGYASWSPKETLLQIYIIIIDLTTFNERVQLLFPNKHSLLCSTYVDSNINNRITPKAFLSKSSTKVVFTILMDVFIFQVSVVKDLLRFAQVFSQMIHIGIELPLVQVTIL